LSDFTRGVVINGCQKATAHGIESSPLPRVGDCNGGFADAGCG
jgi:hypothetical protein